MMRSKAKVTFFNDVTNPRLQMGSVCTGQHQMSWRFSCSMGNIELSEMASRYSEDVSTRDSYLDLQLLGEGVYGKVTKCMKLDTNEILAMKILHKHMLMAGKREVAIYKKLKQLDSDKNNIVRFVEHFIHRGHVCLIFELLDLSLEDLLIKRSFEPLSLSEIRVIAQQMLVALDALKSIDLAHTDIKPDNIMLVNHKTRPFKLKLIDFGLARPVSEMKPGLTIQAVCYRAPEVMLGLPVNEAVDMWGVGCVLAFTYLGHHLFSSRNSSGVMRAIVELFGQPDKHLLDNGLHTTKYFKKDPKTPSGSWKLNETGQKLSKGISHNISRLMQKTHQKVKDAREYKDTQAFLSLLKRMLDVDPDKRITPTEALGHRFITMRHFHSNIGEKYVKSAFLTFEKCRLEEPFVEVKPFVTSSEVIPIYVAPVSGSNNPLAADGGAAKDANNGPPAKAGLENTAAAGIIKKPAGTKEATLPDCVNHNSDEINAKTEEGTSGFVEVKSQKKWMKNLFKPSGCCTVDVIE